MRIHTFLLSVILLSVTIFSFGCTGSNPIIGDITGTILNQAAFSSRMLARFDPDTGIAWFGAPPGTIKPGTAVSIAIDGQSQKNLASNNDGSFLYRTPGTADSFFDVEWYDYSGVHHVDEVAATNPSDDLVSHIGETGLYCNRMYKAGGRIWVINSGDDELASYDISTLEKLPDSVTTPAFSNPWEAQFDSPSSGIITTLFNGVFRFDTSTGSVQVIDADGHREFASPNGVAIEYGSAWVTNTNPISYFPTSHDTGWISNIDINSRKVVYEMDTSWLNPQNVITDGEYVYFSCTGTVDFAPPDYIATAMTSGGIFVLDPGSHKVIRSFDLGLSAPSVMALSPDSRYLYIGSGVAAWIFRIDLDEGKVLNDSSNPIVVSDFPGSYIPFLKVNQYGLIATASFNDDVIRFLDSSTGELDPYPFFAPIELHPGDPDSLWGPQDAVFTQRNGQSGMLFITTIDSSFHWLEI